MGISELWMWYQQQRSSRNGIKTTSEIARYGIRYPNTVLHSIRESSDPVTSSRSSIFVAEKLILYDPYTPRPRIQGSEEGSTYKFVVTYIITGFSNRPIVAMIRYHLNHPLTPRPLRLSRLRTLRHWTIHRAAQLLLHKERARRERELERQYNAMRAACEELRVGVGDGGRLYRQAIDRKGIYGGLKVGEDASVIGNGGVPIEYSRAQTEGPPRGGFDEGWTRG